MHHRPAHVLIVLLRLQFTVYFANCKLLQLSLLLLLTLLIKYFHVAANVHTCTMQFIYYYVLYYHWHRGICTIRCW